MGGDSLRLAALRSIAVWPTDHAPVPVRNGHPYTLAALVHCSIAQDIGYRPDPRIDASRDCGCGLERLMNTHKVVMHEGKRDRGDVVRKLF